ncbi:hypothetical protein BDZ97DRAFT_1814598 [Flammula alnicola]|nr:hypothetical protein BDZ97DRAFT_1814598 [Flammula alnicola]
MPLKRRPSPNGLRSSMSLTNSRPNSSSRSSRVTTTPSKSSKARFCWLLFWFPFSACSPTFTAPLIPLKRSPRPSGLRSSRSSLETKTSSVSSKARFCWLLFWCPCSACSPTFTAPLIPLLLSQWLWVQILEKMSYSVTTTDKRSPRPSGLRSSRSS